MKHAIVAPDRTHIIRRIALVVMGAAASSMVAPLAAHAQTMPPFPRSYVCGQAEDSVVIDGRIEENSWRQAPWTEDFVDIEGDRKPAPRFRTRAKMVWDRRYFYFAAELQEPHVVGTLRQRDTVIFYDNDFEIFIDPNGDNHEYYEFEMNALNTVWDLFLPIPYRDGGKAVDSWNIDGLKTAVHVMGTLNDPSDIDSGWTVEVAMPWEALRKFAHGAAPPNAGDQWRVSFSRVEWLYEIVDGSYRKVRGRPEDNWVWSPQWVVDMHRPELWGYVQFAGAMPEQFRPDGTWEAKMLLCEVYYRACSFRKTHNEWPAGLGDLNVELQGGEVEYTKDDAGFTATAVVRHQQGGSERWHIRQDSKLWKD